MSAAENQGPQMGVLPNGELHEATNFDGTFTAGVPESSTWGMLPLGFAGIGFTAYRRKSKPALMTA
jgi:hypothetical protein